MRLILTKWKHKTTDEIIYTIGNTLGIVPTFKPISETKTLEFVSNMKDYKLRDKYENLGSKIKH